MMARRSTLFQISVAVVTVSAFVVWAQSAGVLFGGLAAGGGTQSAGDTTITGFLGSWHSTVPVVGASGIRVEAGLVRASDPGMLRGDIDGDGDVDFTDFLSFAASFGSESGDPAYRPASDFDGSGREDFGDFLAFADAFDG